MADKWGQFDNNLSGASAAWDEPNLAPILEGDYWDAPASGGGSATVQYLIVAGGGAGGRSAFGISMAGGGGGGVLTGTTTITATGTYPIVVGAGGAVAPPNSFTTPAGNGGNSSFNGLEAIGGGGAGALDAPNGRNGGSGGGGSRAGTAGNGTSGQGFAGGVALAGDEVNTSGGGGGAGGAGGNGKTAAQQPAFQLRGGDGGPGVSSSITGSAVTYGGGGGGGRGGAGGAGGGGTGGGAPGDLPAASGAPNTGGGGGGSYFGASPDVPGGAGGSGIVVIRYATGDITATGGTITTVGGDTVHTFTSSGDFVVTAVGGGTTPVTGTGAAVAPVLNLAQPTASGSGAFAVAGVTGTGAAIAPTLNLSQPTASGSGAFSVNPVSGAGAAVAPVLALAQPIAAGAGAFTTPGLSGVTFTATKVGVNEAPQSVDFVATATGIADQADAVIFWDFGDDYQFRYLPSSTKGNDRQSGTAIGHRAAHVYRSPGTYTVTCTAYQFTASGIATVSTTQNVVIDAVDPAITARVAISRNGDFTGAPSGATQQTWTGSEGAFTFQPNTAYYFQAGQNFTRALNAANFTGGGRLKIHRYGTGANPVIERNLTVWGSNHGPTSICEVEFLGPFDVNQNPNWFDTNVYPTAPPAPPESGIFIFTSTNHPSVLIYGVKSSGFQINYYLFNQNTSAINHVVDCEATNWFDYGVLDANRGSSGHVGCRYHQKVGTQPLPVTTGNRQWNVAGVPNTARQGAARITDANNLLVNKCSALSYRSGWSGSIQPGIAAIQPALRVGTSTINNETACVSQNDIQGGFQVFGASVQNTDTAQGAVALYVFESNYLAQGLDGETSEYFATTKPGAHVRGNVFEYLAGIPVLNTVGTQIRVVFENGAQSFGSNRTSFVYGNTLVVNGNTPGVNWQTATQIGASSRPIVYENNVFQMNGTFNSAGSGALFQTNWNPLQSAFPFAPQTGSAAFQTYSTGRLSPLEQDGSVRQAPFSLGASEESSSVTGIGAAVLPTLNLAQPVASGSGALGVGAVTGTGAAILPTLNLAQPVVAASGTNIAPVAGAGVAVAPTLNLAQPVAAGVGVYSAQGVVGAGAAVAPILNLSQPVAAGAGVFLIGVVGTGAAVAPTLNLAQPVASGVGFQPRNSEDLVGQRNNMVVPENPRNNMVVPENPRNNMVV